MPSTPTSPLCTRPGWTQISPRVVRSMRRPQDGPPSGVGDAQRQHAHAACDRGASKVRGFGLHERHDRRPGLEDPGCGGERGRADGDGRDRERERARAAGRACHGRWAPRRRGAAQLELQMVEVVAHGPSSWDFRSSGRGWTPLADDRLRAAQFGGDLLVAALLHDASQERVALV